MVDAEKLSVRVGEGKKEGVGGVVKRVGRK